MLSSSFPQDLVYKGVLKVTYDRGYVLQTKSVLTESTSTVEEVIDQLIDALGLTGSCDDYVLEERNLLTHGKSGPSFKMATAWLFTQSHLVYNYYNN